MTQPLFELAKVGALAAAIALALTHVVSDTDAALAGAVAFWLLLARIT